MLKFFRLPFATTGDKTAVPDAVDSNGNVSYSQGYGFDYQRQKTDPAAKNIERDKMNQIFFDMTTAIAEIQRQGIPDFITSALNGGSAFSYGQYAVVRYSGDNYISLVAANTALPSDATKWAPLPNPARLQQAAYTSAVAGGTVDAITAAFAPAIAALPAAPGTLSVFVRAGGANATTTPTFKADATTAKTIVKGANQALVAGDIAGAGHWLELQYDATLDKWVLQNPANGVFVPVAQQPGGICYFAQNSAPTGFLKANGATVSRSSYAALFAALVKYSTVAISIATPGVVTWNSHGRSANDPVKFTTTGALPTGLTTGTTYYVVGSSITANTFTVSATPGGAAINTSGSQSGAQTAVHSPFGDGDGSTTFTLPDLRGEFPRGWDDSRAVDINRAFGSAQTDQIQGHEHTQIWSSGANGTTTAGSGRTPANGPTSGIVTDGTNGTPRVGTETRPRNVALLACIKY